MPKALTVYVRVNILFLTAFLEQSDGNSINDRASVCSSVVMQPPLHPPKASFSPRVVLAFALAAGRPVAVARFVSALTLPIPSLLFFFFFFFWNRFVDYHFFYSFFFWNRFFDFHWSTTV